MIRIRRPSGEERERSAGRLADAVESRRDPGESGGASGVRRRAEVTVRFADREEPVFYRGELVGYVEQLEEGFEGILELTDEALVLWKGGSVRRERGNLPGPSFGESGSGGAAGSWDLRDISAIQTSSSAVQIAARAGGVVHFQFHEDSPKRWDRLLQDAVRRIYSRAGWGEIVEFQPRIVVRGAAGDGGEGGASSPVPAGKASRIHAAIHGGRVGATGEEDLQWVPERRLSWYSFFKVILQAFVAVSTRTRVEGVEHVPSEGPYILVANHQSLLDPILVQTALPRPLHTFTKSTQFSKAYFRWVLNRIYGIPTRRYRVDPQVIRVALRRLVDGKAVGIYPEGERSWDGVVQPFRQGTVRFLLGAGVPVVPCGISGSYDVWPRWSRALKRRRVSIRFGPAIHWEPLGSREARERATPAAEETLRQALAELGAWMGAGEEAEES